MISCNIELHITACLFSASILCEQTLYVQTRVVTLPLTVKKKLKVWEKMKYFQVLTVFALISTYANVNNYTINSTKDDKGVELNTLLTVIQKIDIWVKSMKSLNDNVVKFLPEPILMNDMIDEMDKNIITFKRDVKRWININHRRINVMRTKLR